MQSHFHQTGANTYKSFKWLYQNINAVLQSLGGRSYMESKGWLRHEEWCTEQQTVYINHDEFMMLTITAETEVYFNIFDTEVEYRAHYLLCGKFYAA